MNTKLSPRISSIAKRSTRSLLASLALAPLAMAGQLIVVDVNGTGDFNDIQAAVTVSQPGDMILVLAGEYGGFTVADKSVHIAAVDGAPVTLNGRVVVRNTIADSVVTLRGLASLGGLATGAAEEGLWAKNMQGTLRLEECEFKSYRSGESVPPAVRLEQCDNVTFTGCTVTGTNYGYYPSSGGDGLVATGSNLAIFRSTITGGPSGGTGGIGMELLGTTGRLFMTDSTVRGGWGYYGSCPEWSEETSPGDGGAGLVNGGWDAWAQNSTIQGGSGGIADWSFFWCMSPNGTTGQDVTGPLMTMAGDGRELDMDAVVSVTDNTIRITVRGEVGDRVFLRASLTGDFGLGARQDGPILLSSPFLALMRPVGGGPSQLGGGIPLALQSQFLGVIGPAMNLTYQVPILPLPGNDVRSVQLQASVADTNGVVWMSNARTLSIVP